jgi:hypothetical protein
LNKTGFRKGGAGCFIIGGLALAVAIALGATITGGLAHQEQATSCPGEGGSDCTNYHVYGWPWAWRNDAPDRLIDLWRERETSLGEETDMWDLYHGRFSLGWLLFTFLVWFLVVLLIEAGTAAISWVVSRLIVTRKRPSPT